jgi:phosphate transport system permease protein
LLAIVPFVEHVLARSRPLAGVHPAFAVNQPTGFSILAGGIVLAVMIAPFSSRSSGGLATVPNDLRHASLAVGATRWQTIRRIVLPQVAPGIVAAVVLRFARSGDHRRPVVVGNVPNIPTPS